MIVLLFLAQPDSGHYYGFAYFRQVKDADIKRGYFQKVQFVVHCTALLISMLVRNWQLAVRGVCVRMYFVFKSWLETGN